MYFGLNRIISTVFLVSLVQGNEYFKMSKISDDMEEILYSMNATTMTSCQMHCNRICACYSIGLAEGSSKGPLYDCFLLKRKFDASTKPKNEVKMIKLESLNNLEKGWKRYKFVCDDELPLKSKHLMTIKKLSKQYKVHLEVKRTQYVTDDFGNIAHFSAGGFHGEYGDRTPYICFHKNINQGLHITSAVNGYPNYGYDTKVLYPLDKWIEVEVTQIKVGQDFIFSISVDGKVLHSVKNTQPRDFSDVKVFIGDMRFIVEQPGFIRNLWMMVKD